MIAFAIVLGLTVIIIIVNDSLKIKRLTKENITLKKEIIEHEEYLEFEKKVGEKRNVL